MTRSAAILWLVLSAALAGCGTTGENAPQASGPIDQGTSLVPRSQGGGDVYGEAYDLAGLAGRKLLHTEPIAWTSLSGASNDVAHESARVIGSEAHARGFDFVLAVMPVSGANRDTIALPPGYGGAATFANPDVRQAFLDEVAWLVGATKPAYLSLATEIQGYERAHPADYASFATLAQQAYDLVKSIRPATRVFVYFQYEAVYRDFPGGPAAVARNLADLVAPFEPKLDLVGLSSYPGLLGGADGSSGTLPDDYYTRLAGVLAHPLFFAELGHPSRLSLTFLPGSETEQAAFIGRFAELTSGLDVEAKIWSFLHDPDLSTLPPGAISPSEGAFFGSCGLRSADGSEKPAWSAWLAGS